MMRSMISPVLTPMISCSTRLRSRGRKSLCRAWISAAFFGDGASQAAFERNLAVLRAAGAEITEIEDELFTRAGRHVFQSPMVAEHLDAYEDVMRSRPETTHPAVR